MQRAALLQKLRSLADHPATPEHERAAARERIAAIEDAARAAQPIGRTVPSGKARLGSIQARPRRRPFPDAWPFGWTGPRVPIEHEVVGGNEAVVVGWKCPSCGAQVERRLDARALLRLARPVTPGKPAPLYDHITSLTDGSHNQLCIPCWDRWDAA